MKHILILLASVITITLAAWLLAGFVVWDWNPKNWTEASRLTLVVISAGLWLLAGFVARDCAEQT